MSWVVGIGELIKTKFSIHEWNIRNLINPIPSKLNLPQTDRAMLNFNGSVQIHKQATGIGDFPFPPP